MAYDSLRDGYVSICFDTSNNAQKKLATLVIEGQKLAAGATATADQLVRVTSGKDAEINAMFGQGSIIGEALKVAAGCCGNDAVDIYALPRNPPAGAVAAVKTLTVTRSAAGTAGRIDLFYGDSRYNVSVEIGATDTQDQIAAKIQAATPANLPWTATVATNVVTYTAKNPGVAGSHMNIQTNWHGRNNYLPSNVTFALASPTAGTGELTAVNYDTVFNECCVGSLALLDTGAVAQTALQKYLDDKWDCAKPQCFGHGYVPVVGTLGQILARDTNAATLSKMANCTAEPLFPYLKVAAYAATSQCRTVNNPEVSIEGDNFGVLSCLAQPESCATCFTVDEQTQIKNAGFVITVPQSGGQGALTSPVVVNDVTNNRFDAEGRPNSTFSTVTARRQAVAVADAVAKQFKTFQGFGYFTENTDVREGTRGVNKRMIEGQMRAWLKSQVGVLFSAFDNLDDQFTVRDDFETANRCAGKPGVLHVALKYSPSVRLAKVNVGAVPQLLNNC